MLRWKSSLKPAAAAPATGITLQNQAENEGHSGYSSPYNISVSYPAVSANDIMLAIISTERQTNFDGTPPTGWTKVIETDGDYSQNSTQAIYWKLATTSGSSSTGNSWGSIMNSGQPYYAWVGAYSGCNTSNPIDASAGSGQAYGTSWSQSITTQTDNAMVVSVAGSDNESRTFAWSDGTELKDKSYQSTASVSINEKIESTAGAKTRSGTISSAISGTMTAVALKPAAAATDYRSTILADNPLFYYRLGEASGTDAYDEVAAADNGTYYNTPDLGETGAISGDSNTSVKFNEANSEYAETVTLSSETSLLPCTIECFLKLDGASDSNAGIVFYRSGSNSASGLNMKGTSTGVKRLGYHWRDQSGTWGFGSGPTLGDDTWYYVALVVESTKATFYVIEEDGTLTTAVNTLSHSALDCSNDGWHFARDTAYGNRYFQGWLDEIALYDQALSETTLEAHAAAAGFSS